MRNIRTVLKLLIQLLLLDKHAIQSTPSNNYNNDEQIAQSKTCSDEQPTPIETWPPRHIVDNVKDARNRIIVVTTNCGYLEMTDNFLSSLLRLDITNFVIVPVDERSYPILSKAYPDHVVPPFPSSSSRGIAEAADYNTNEFQYVTKSRPAILLEFAKLGYATYYCDVDTVWLSDAFLALDRYDDRNDLDAVFVRDVPDGGKTWLCSCMIYFKPTKNAISFLARWAMEMEADTEHMDDQIGLNIVFEERRSHLRFKIASVLQFPPGCLYFRECPYVNEACDCKHFPVDEEEVWEKAVIVHNNWIVGFENKKERFARHGMWKLSSRLGEYDCAEKGL